MRKTPKQKSDLVKAIHEMAAHRQGKLALPSRILKIPEQMDVASIRREIGMTQRECSNRYGFILSTLKDWEQGRRAPERSARILLTLIAVDRRAVDGVLRKLSV